MMRRAAAIALGLGLAAAALAARASPLPIRLEERPLRFEVPKPQRTVLPGGVVVYLLEDPTIPSVEVSAIVPAGAADDPPGMGGLAEVSVEAVRSGGAGGRDPRELEEALADRAAKIDARTTPDLVIFTLWTPRSAAPEALGLFADLLRRPLLDPGAVRTARERRMEEARREDDEPETVVRREFIRRIFAGEPYGNWPTAESVSRITRASVRDFHRRHFGPPGLLITAAGDFDAPAMLERLRALFGDWTAPPEVEGRRRGMAAGPPSPASPGPAPDPAAGSGDAQRRGMVVIPRDLSQTNLMLGHAGPRWDDPDLPALEVVGQILSYYRYFVDVRDNRGLAYTAYADFDARRRGGVFLAYAGTRADATRETLDLMRRHLEEVAAGKLTDEEARGARETVVASFVHRFATAADTVREFAIAEAQGHPADWLPGYARRVAALTLSDLRGAARRHLRPQDLLLVVVGDPKQVGSDPGR